MREHWSSSCRPIVFWLCVSHTPIISLRDLSTPTPDRNMTSSVENGLDVETKSTKQNWQDRQADICCMSTLHAHCTPNLSVTTLCCWSDLI